jgi:DNA-binding NtrC family response regulator
MRSVLLVDADPHVLDLLGNFFESRGWHVQRATDASGGFAFYEQERPDLVLLDVRLPGVSGLQLLEVMRSRDEDTMIIMLVGIADMGAAAEALRLGAESLLIRPLTLAHVEAAVDRACEKNRLRMLNRFLAGRQPRTIATAALGRSAPMREIARRIEMLAASNSTVLLCGEYGTGKNAVAQLLHSLSARAPQPFVEITCARRPADALEAEVFGHEKGGGGDAKAHRRGLMDVAHAGTCFLEEVAGLDLRLQDKLLDVLEKRRFSRIGGTREIQVDVRFVAATQCDLQRHVRDGSFRDDLFRQLHTMTLHIPSLRERGRDDIADLAAGILTDLHRRTGSGPQRFTPAALAVLTQYDWPGNIRELRNVIDRVVMLSPHADEIDVSGLPAELAGSATSPVWTSEAELSLAEVERRHIARVLAHHSGNRSRAARTLGISRAALYDKLDRYGLGAMGRTPPASGRRES